LDSLKEYLGVRGEDEGEGTTTRSLQEFVGRLNDDTNNGKHLWTPAKLKNMSSWQQQDAQEYYSKILDELDKEALKSLKASTPKPGFESLAVERSTDADNTAEGEIAQESAVKNPLDGLLAQRVACTKCGYSEGLSMIPFNCLTLPLGSSQLAYPLEQCLDEYTKLEEISDVECPKCTLLRAEQQLTKMLPSPPTYRSTDAEPAIDSRTLALPPELRAQAFQRLSAIQHALAEDDFADKTLHETCQIPKKARVSSTKTRQAVIGRAPQSLVLHMNRSVFEETTGIQRKNYAGVRWPSQLDLSSWTLPTDGSEDMDTTASLLAADDGKAGADPGLVYRIKAVVTHYGRHENGHYICYRQYPVRIRVEEELDGVEEDGEEKDGAVEMRWWRLSDEDVTPVSEDEVLKQGGVFMLFYERESMPEVPAREGTSDTTVAEATDTATAAEIASTVVTEQTIQNDASPPSVTETEEPAQAEIDIPEPSPAPSSSMETGPNSTNPTTPSSVTTDSASPFDDDVPSTDVTTEDESECEPPDTPPHATAKHQSPPAEQATPATPPMRTARSQRPESPPGSTSKDGGFGVGGSGFRVVAAT
jgi:ubiquitin carboxyl-terminal hydrolase 1